MSDLLAHPQTKLQLQNLIEHPDAAYIFVGQKYSGKLAAAKFVGDMLDCPASSPDYIHISPNDKHTITIEMAHELVDRLGKKSFGLNRQRLIIIEEADRMTLQAQNALLKLIEEPPRLTTLMLLTTDKQALLSTIQSRCQTVYIRPVEGDEVVRGRAAVQNDPELHRAEAELRQKAQHIINSSSFERLKLAEELAKDPRSQDLLEWLAYELSQAVRAQNASGEILQIMQNYFIYDRAGVARKHALMELMVRL